MIFQLFFFDVCAAMKTTGCNLDKVNMLPNALITPLISSTMIKSEDITPMEVTAEKRSPSIFKVSYIDWCPVTLTSNIKIVIF